MLDTSPIAFIRNLACVPVKKCIKINNLSFCIIYNRNSAHWFERILVGVVKDSYFAIRCMLPYTAYRCCCQLWRVEMHDTNNLLHNETKEGMDINQPTPSK